MNTQNKVSNLLVSKKMDEAGKIERWCLEQLSKELTISDKYVYRFYHTATNASICFDAMIKIYDKNFDKLLKILIVEVKVRDGNYDDLMMEKTKLNNLKKYTNEWQKEGYSIKPDICYICFDKTGSYMFFPEEMKLPKLTTMLCNKVTVDKSQGKVNKFVYLLDKKDAKKKMFCFNEQEYALTLLEEAQKHIQEAQKIIKRIGNIF